MQWSFPALQQNQYPKAHLPWLPDTGNLHDERQSHPHTVPWQPALSDLYKGRLISEETITADVTIVDGTKHVKTPITMPYEIDIKYGSQYISYYTKDVDEYYRFKKQINHRCKAEINILKYGTGDVRIEVEKLRSIPKKLTNMKQIKDYPNLYYNLSGHMVFEMVYNDDPLPGEPEYKYLPLMCGDKFYYYDPDSNEIFVKK